MNLPRNTRWLAVLAGGVVFAGYLLTLAPSVTFWDAGELITAAKTLGIPHPPGSPFFVMLAHVWGLLPIGSYAWRLNLLSALCGATAAGCWFAITRDTVARIFADIDADSRQVLSVAAGFAAALLAGFQFSTWQNSTETEVYSVAMLMVALIALLFGRWRYARFTLRGTRFVLLMLFIGALSVSLHLVTLLVGPAVIAGMAAETVRHRLPDANLRRSERMAIAAFAATWACYIGLGLANPLVLALGGAGLAACGVAGRRGEWRTVVMSAVLLVIAVLPFVFMMLRARQQPWMNEGDPHNVASLVSVISRADFPTRTPVDDPTARHGVGNPGRSLTMIAYQAANYAQYFDWQWARSLGSAVRFSVPRLLVTLLALWIAIRGARAQRHGDPTGFWMVATLFMVAGPALIGYLNFQPGPSIGWNIWQFSAQHEVRDRDYFFVASFVAAAVWVAIGLADIARTWIPRVRQSRRPAMLGVFAFALVPLAGNWRDADRMRSRDATLARDYAWDLLQSVPDSAVLLTYADNDTFPLWYLQAVEGVRPDVQIICLGLTEARWHLKQVKALIGVTDSVIDNYDPHYLGADSVVTLARGDTVHIPRGKALYGQDFFLLHLLHAVGGVRPIAWSTTAASSVYDLGPRLVQRGLVVVLEGHTDQRALESGNAAGPTQAPLDVPVTRELVEHRWKYGRLAQHGELEANVRFVATTMMEPLIQLGAALEQRGDAAGARAVFARADSMTPSRVGFRGPVR